MTFTKEKPGKGRPPGSLSKRNLMLREMLEAKGIDVLDQILVRIPKLPMEQQVRTLVSIMPYLYSRLNSVTIENKTPEELAVMTLSGKDLEARALQILKGHHDNKKEDAETIEIEPSNGDAYETQDD